MTTQKSWFLPCPLWMPNKYVGSMNTLFSAELLIWKIDFILFFITDTWKWSNGMISIGCLEGSTELAEINFFLCCHKTFTVFYLQVWLITTITPPAPRPSPESRVRVLPIAEHQHYPPQLKYQEDIWTQTLFFGLMKSNSNCFTPGLFQTKY